MSATQLRYHIWAGSFVAVIIGLSITCGLTSARWVNGVFPGFFVLENRVIASVGLQHSPITQDSTLYQGLVIAANGQALHSSDELYTYVRTQPPNTLVQYSIQKMVTSSRLRSRLRSLHSETTSSYLVPISLTAWLLSLSVSVSGGSSLGIQRVAASSCLLPAWACFS